MNEAITIIDPNAAAPEPVGYEFSVNWAAFGVASAAVLVTAVIVHRVLKRRLRASAVQIASDALVRRLRVGRSGLRVLRRLARYADEPIGVALLNRSALAAVVAKHHAARPRASERAEVDRLVKRLDS